MHRRHGHGTFQRGSNVREYWLAHCEGFAVVGSGTRSRVRAVVVDPADGRADRVLVGGRTSLRTRVLPVERIESVDPFDRVLYAEARHTIQGTTRRVARAVAAGAGTFQAWLRPRLHASAVATQARSRDAVTWLRPRLQATAVATQVRSRDAAAWLRPRLQATAVATQMRSRELVAWLRPRTAHAARLTTEAVRALSGAVAAQVRRAISSRA